MGCEQQKKVGYYIGKSQKDPRGRAGIEPATSRTRSENHTSRPTARRLRRLGGSHLWVVADVERAKVKV